MSCASDEVLKLISGFDTTHDAWITHEKSYASRSRARIIQVKEEIYEWS